jgi:acetyltransferase-like isoleucine patch superfamily enzyme
VFTGLIGRVTLRLYHTVMRTATLLFSVLVSGAFARFGAGSRLALPIHLVGTAGIAIGRGVYVGPGSALHNLSSKPGVTVTIGDGTRITGGCFIAGVHGVTIEAEVLMGKNVHIADHTHKFSVPEVSVMHQGLDKIAPVFIGRGAWLGQGVVICPGVTIGQGAVIGANSVVNSDIESHAVAVGSPARVVKRLVAQ